LDNLVAVSTPEPSVAFLSGSGLLTLILFRRRQREWIGSGQVEALV